MNEQDQRMETAFSSDFLSKYEFEQQNKYKLWQVFLTHFSEPDFRFSKYAGVMLAVLPNVVNLAFIRWRRHHVLRFPITLGFYIGCLYNFNH